MSNFIFWVGLIAIGFFVGRQFKNQINHKPFDYDKDKKD